MSKLIGLSFNGVATVYRGEAAEFGVKVAPSGIGSARAERLAGELSRRLRGSIDFRNTRQIVDRKALASRRKTGA